MISCHSGLQNLITQKKQPHLQCDLMRQCRISISENPTESNSCLGLGERERSREALADEIGQRTPCTVNWRKTKVQVQQQCNDSSVCKVSTAVVQVWFAVYGRYSMGLLKSLCDLLRVHWGHSLAAIFNDVTVMWVWFRLLRGPTPLHSLIPFIRIHHIDWKIKTSTFSLFQHFFFSMDTWSTAHIFFWQHINENNSEYTVALQWYQAVATKHVVTFCLLTVETQQLNTASYRYFTCICFKGVNTSFILNGRESRDHSGTFIQRQVSQL